MNGWSVLFLITAIIFSFLFFLALIERERPHRIVKIIAKTKVQDRDEDENLIDSWFYFFTLLGNYENDIAKRVEVDEFTYNSFEINDKVIYKV